MVGWLILTSLFSTNTAISQTKGQGWRAIQHRDKLTGTVVFVVVDKFRNCWEWMFLGKIVKSFCILPNMIVFDYSGVHAASTYT